VTTTDQATPQLGSRALFAHLEPAIYLNHAAVSPPSDAVRAAIAEGLDGYSRVGVAQFPVEVERRARLRGLLGALIGAPAEDVALVPNTSAGVVDIALCLPWQRGDRVVLFRGEFPTNITPWQRAAVRHGLELVWQDAERFRTDRDGALQALDDELRAGVRLVACSAVQFQTGLRMPLEAIGALCQSSGAELFVDAIQAVGCVPLDVEALGITYLTAGGHKWLMGPEGTGMLYAQPDAAARLRPDVAAWLSHESSLVFLFEGAGKLRYDRPIMQRAGMVEGGAFNALGLAGLEASAGLIAELGVRRVFDHIQAWHDAFMAAFERAGLPGRGWQVARTAHADGRSGILSLRPPGDPTDPSVGAPAWAQALSAHGVSCACPDGWLRLAPHWPNALTEAPAVVDAMLAVERAGGPGA
jgi:selenocysteine lyase/cysteine desulfurase